MIKIVDSLIFVEGKETTDPVLIGYAMLDFVDNIELFKAKSIQDYLLDHGSNDEIINNKIRELEGLK